MSWEHFAWGLIRLFGIAYLAALVWFSLRWIREQKGQLFTASRWLKVLGLILSIVLLCSLLAVLTMSIGCLDPDKTNYSATHPCYDWVTVTTKVVAPK